jgi:predicted transcriptional regulator YdeE
MDVFIVRIYRNDKKNPHTLIGIVEEVTKKRKKAFKDYDELWEILISEKEKKRR